MTPTKAQIDAAAKAIATALAPAYFEREEPTDEDHLKAAQAALTAAVDLCPSCGGKSGKHYLTSCDLYGTAAAEAGEQREPDEMCLRVGHKWVIECQRCGDNRTVQSEIIAAIERCAQWHDEQEKLFRSNKDPDYQMVADWHHNSAAAIRALKDKP